MKLFLKYKVAFKKFMKIAMLLLVSLLVVVAVAQAGSLSPLSSPAATSYTLSDIYTRLTTNGSATAGNHSFSATTTPTATFQTLTDIYNAIPSILAGTVKLGTSYLGVAGTLTPDGGTAGVADLFNGKTANLTADWTLDTGTLNLACNTATFDGAGNLVANSYDGAGSGANRWCITDSGDAAAGDILSGKIAWTDGQAVTGSIAVKSGDADASVSATSTNKLLLTPAVGYYNGSTATVSTTSTTFTATNIRSGTYLFGVVGTLLEGYIYGDSDASKALTTATGAGTYNATNLTTSTVKKGTAFGVSSTGTYSGYPGTGWSGTAITQSACDTQNPTWYWFEDGNGDGDTTDAEDGVCVKATTVTSLSWNGSEQIGAAVSITGRTATGGASNTIADTDGATMTVNAYANMVVKVTSGAAASSWGIVKSNTSDTITVYGSWLDPNYNTSSTTPDATSVFGVYTDGFDLYDNSWIGDWSCIGSFPTGAPSWGSFPTSAQVGAGFIALATTDCYDGTRDLLPTETSRTVKTGTATATSTTSITDSSLSLNTNAWVGQKVLITGGTGSGGYGRIESNTGTVITVNSWTGGNPDTGSTFGIIYLIPHASYNPTTNIDGDTDDHLNGNNGPLTQEFLNNWKGTRLPTSSDFFGYCGYKDGGSNYESTTGTYTADKTYGNSGGQIGRTDEFLDLANSGSWEWLSEQAYQGSARVAGSYGCSNFGHTYVYSGYRFRALFRP